MNLRCFQYCKDTNFKANHNMFYDYFAADLDVSNIAKILILKQITTEMTITHTGLEMFPILQRY